MTQHRRPALFSGLPDRRAYAAEWLAKQQVGGLHRPVTDPACTGYLARNHIGVRAEVLFGKVVDFVAYTHCYRVFLEGGHPPVTATPLAQSGLLPFGARQVNTIPLGSSVWVLVHHQLPHALILGVEPDPNVDPRMALSDFVHQAGRCGLRVDRTHSSVLKLNNKGRVTDWSAGRPFDSTGAGEWGAISETGLRVLLDSGMVQLGVDEFTGVSAFYEDQLLRLGGLNLSILSSGGEHEVLHDGAEIHEYKGSTPFPWEQRGALTHGMDPFRDVDYKAYQIEQPHYSAIEPQHDDQMPFHRRVELGGYLGQGGKRLILVPPSSETYRYGEGDAPLGVFEEQLSLTGRYAVRAAKGVHIAKRIVIPGPKRTMRAEDNRGDTEENYRFAGAVGSGEAHEISGGIETSDEETPHLQEAAGVMDEAARVFNWEGAHPLHYHERDWKLDDESETPFKTGQAKIPFTKLRDAFYLDRPDPVTAVVDHRYGEVEYFPNESYISLLDSGGVVIGDGYGAEIRLAGGHIFLTAPGDVWLKAGRNVNTWAGHDAIIRAKNSWDVSASKGDGRLKAEKNLQVLAGNDSDGGGVGAVLIESRAPSRYDYEGKVGEDVQAGGVHIKCSQGELTAWANNIYLRTGGGDIQPGTITLDAGAGTSEIVTNSATFRRYLGSAAVDNFGSSGKVTGVNLYQAEFNSLAGQLSIGGYTQVRDGGMTVKGYIGIVGGHISSELASDSQGLVGSLEGTALQATADAITDGDDAQADATKSQVEAWDTLFGKFWYGDKRPGSDAVIKAVGFSFRNEEQYRTSKFRLWEDRWQQVLRLAGGQAGTWKESAVRSGSEETYPYPGQAKWKDEETLLQQDLTLYDQEAGVARPRDPSLYGKPKYKDPTKATPDGNYAVIF